MTGADHQDDRELESGAGADLAGAGMAGAPVDGLSWSWEVDLEALVAAVADPAPWERDIDKSPSRPDAVPSPVDADAELAEYLEAVEAGRSWEIPLAVVAGRIAESVPAGAGLAGWLAAGPVSGLEDGALAGMAGSYRRLASWAQAGELSFVAELASRSAAANERIGVDDQGRPGRLPDEACAEVSLALVMSQGTASWWTDLGVTLRWRLAATGAALRAGSIDLARARAIAEATALLDDETARAVEALLLAGAGTKTLAGLRAALRRAVIAADPQGAERRREEAEQRAKVVLYPDVEGTASLAGYNLPGVRAAAAMARISQQCLTEPQETADLPPILARVLAAAQAAATRAASDGQVVGGCAHAGATPAYRPTRTLWEYATARDLTCRFGPCRQPATRCDLDHTIPFDQGGRTCSCNLGGLCRFHHQVKGRPRWHLTQVTSGTFTWTTPTGRTYTVQPDSYAA